MELIQTNIVVQLNIGDDFAAVCLPLIRMIVLNSITQPTINHFHELNSTLSRRISSNHDSKHLQASHLRANMREPQDKVLFKDAFLSFYTHNIQTCISTVYYLLYPTFSTSTSSNDSN